MVLLELKFHLHMLLLKLYDESKFSLKVKKLQSTMVRNFNYMLP
jgi:hypothetical protein